MINLLPPEKKKALRHEYRGRVMVVVGWLFSTLMIMVLVVLLALLVATRAKQVVISNQLTTLQKEAEAKGSLEFQSNLKSLSSKVVILASAATSTPFTRVLKTLLSHKQAGISLTNLAFSHQAGQAATLGIGGLAASRADLLQFIDTLRQEPLFKQIDSPVSNLIKDKNADFVITITING